jgi:hypothetical protein
MSGGGGPSMVLVIVVVVGLAISGIKFGSKFIKVCCCAVAAANACEVQDVKKPKLHRMLMLELSTKTSIRANSEVGNDAFEVARGSLRSLFIVPRLCEED